METKPKHIKNKNTGRVKPSKWKLFKSNLKYSDTFLLELFSLFPIMTYMPYVAQNCPGISSFWAFIFPILGLWGLWGTIFRHINTRYLYAQIGGALMGSFSILAFFQGWTHYYHFSFLLFQISIFAFLVWRLGTEINHRSRGKGGR